MTARPSAYRRRPGPSGEGRSPAPCLGEHTEYVCKEILNLSDEEIAQLLVDEVLR